MRDCRKTRKLCWEYITGANPTTAILLIHGLFGWTFPPSASSQTTTRPKPTPPSTSPVFFGGEGLDTSTILAERWADSARSASATVGWAVHRLGAQEFVDAETGRGLVDCVAAGHPSLLTERDVEEVAGPVQRLTPEVDWQYTREMKVFEFETLQRKGVPLDYVHFPGVAHGALVRGDEGEKGEKEAMARVKSAAVAWQRWWLHGV
ncbi:hypothetical protein QBC34DRAFT_440525 [Podospora aff. communis PSN243]|uniref:Dienelactone hydrolase domain-containing protein n=1 Tax=Podospora aff. communis PSN243 TaxID=3040156 RepID=A0AAV9GF79_9PEZI|nr:hypothetical protein QBC34DRAFT_440525 [Podospora aff. communis PSN243]